MLITDGLDFFSDEKVCTDSRVSWVKDGVPGFSVTNTCRQGVYVLEKVVLTDPRRHVLLQRTRFTVRKGAVGDYRLFVLLTPHLGNRGSGNSARLGDFKGIPMLIAENGQAALALACSLPWQARTVGYVGSSDAWHDLHAHKRLTRQYDLAENGYVSLTGEIDLSDAAEFVLAVGFGRGASEAGHRMRASLAEGFDACRRLYEQEWTGWQNSLCEMESTGEPHGTAYRVSTAVLATHESKDFQGGEIASLSFPWGEIHGDEDQGGYHLVWPRDAYESASALLAAGATDEVLRVLTYFAVTQEADGHWPQNMWLDGSQFWTGTQLDETAAPILLFDLARRSGKIAPAEFQRFWPMVRQAAAFIVQHGPSSPEDRWEEDAGLTAYTLATIIAALLVAADVADAHHEDPLASYLRETADAWNDSIERWTYVEGTELARRIGVSGYYLRLAPPSELCGPIPTPLADKIIRIANVSSGEEWFPATDIVSVDALALVRFGLRAADDPRIVNTVRAIDAVLKVETPRGPCWHRYNHDGYGEHADGSPFDGSGIGRVWPLFVGERAALRNRRGTSRRGVPAAGSHGKHGVRFRTAARANLERGSDSRQESLSRAAQRLGAATSLGPRRASQIASLASRPGGLRHTAPAGSSLSRRPPPRGLRALAI